MTLIVAKIRDSVGAPVANGRIVVTLTYDLLPAGQNYTVTPAFIDLNASGEATFNLQASEVDNVAYKFELFRRETVNSAFVYYPIREAFYATVPDQVAPLPFSELVPTGIGQDALDTSFTAIVRRLSSSEDFWTRLTDEVVTARGVYDPVAFYSRGDTVFFQGWSFRYIYPQTVQAPAPVLGTQTLYWTPWAARGQDGAGTTGADVAYNATAWATSLTAVSQKSLHQMIGSTLARQSDVTGFANAVDGTLTRPVLASNPLAADNSLLVPSTSWVRAITNELVKAIVPIGTVTGFAGTSAPALWVLCDGRTVSRTTYAGLFAVVGTAYNTGGEAGTDFRLPDLRGRSLVGPDNMSALRGPANRLTANNSMGASAGTQDRSIAQANLPYYTSDNEAAGWSLANLANGFTNRVPITRAAAVTALNVMNPYQVVNYIIYAGV